MLRLKKPVMSFEKAWFSHSENFEAMATQTLVE